MAPLVEIDALEVLVIVDNEVDPMSPYTQPSMTVSGQMKDLALFSPFQPQGRGPGTKELRMSVGIALCLSDYKTVTRLLC